MRGASGLLNWERIRALAELRILTRISYLMLVVVPLVASLWPGLRLAVNTFNKSSTEAREALEGELRSLADATKRLNELLLRLTSSSAAQIPEIIALLDASRDHIASFDRLSGRIELKLYWYGVRPAPTSPDLPTSIAVSFFAALSIVIAHMLYQWSAPSIIRRYTLNEYEDAVARSFADSIRCCIL